MKTNKLTNNELLSYAHILWERNEFRRAGTRSGSEFNYFDSPTNTYFKIFFYFNNGDEMGSSDLSGGLLAPTWDVLTTDEYYKYSSAWSYLKMNGEEDRADKLKKFITLLSNISSYAPWTFKSISGLDTALERKTDEFKVEEERRKISIQCQPDTYDQRIGTLLDLYRDVVWSWGTKREMIPSNLRKFDMGIYIFSDPVKTIHQSNDEENSANLMDGTGSYQTSSKYIEFHNCEFDYNSSKSGYGEMTNEEGKQWEYTIDIMFDDVYEMRYNEFMMRKIGDILEYDINIAAEKTAQGDSISHMEELEARVNYYQSGMIENAVKEILGAGSSIITNKINNIVLGNLFTASLSTISHQIKGAAKGHILSTASALDDYIAGNYKPKAGPKILGNLFKNI